MRFYRGTAVQAVDPLISAKQGSGNAPAYRGTAYVVFEHFPLGRLWQPHPAIPVRGAAAGRRLPKNIRGVALIPGATEFGLSPTPVTRQIRAGRDGRCQPACAVRGTDFWPRSTSCIALSELEHVALVVTWFGNDLSAGNCPIRPAVTTTARPASPASGGFQG